MCRTDRCCTRRRASRWTSVPARRWRTCAVIHGAHVGAEALIANHATVLDGAVIGARSLVAAHSLVTAGTQIPAGVLAVGVPAQIKGPIAGTGAEMWVNLNPQAYRDLAQRHIAGLEPI